MIELREGGLDHPAVMDLLALHLSASYAETPAENAHALGAEGLRDPAVTFVTAWDGDALLGMGALKAIGPRQGEVKSMRTVPGQQRRGVARFILGRLIETARARGWTRISLETGTALSFAPANALYEAFGFVDGPVFGGYSPSPHNRFMLLAL